MPDKLSRRYQVQPDAGCCAICPAVTFVGPGAKMAALRHIRATGHEVRIFETRLIIIAPQAAEAAAR